MRVELASYMRPLMARIAKLVGAERDEIVLVPNASHGVSTVLWNIEWHEQDILVGSQCHFISSIQPPCLFHSQRSTC